ncbi:MAG TPA: hypothetical protein VN771_02150 [Candidatus Baltobacteraceae bacterium]|nr:hypothetical protein [Candidatus Baltobacteraceae bacterium]
MEGGGGEVVGANRPVAAYATLTPNSDDTLVPPTAVITYHVLPETAVTHVADHDPPDTVPVVVTMVPAGMLTIEAADVAGDSLSRAVQFAA